MDFKLVMFSVACFAILIQPAQSGNFPYIILNTIRNIASASTHVAGAEVAAGIMGATNVASNLVNKMGEKIGAVAGASGLATNAGANGVIAIGNSIGNAGNAIAADTIASLGKVLVGTPVVQEVVEKVEEVDTPRVVEENVVEPCEQRVVSVDSIPLRTVQLKVRQPTTFIESRVASGNKMSPVMTLLRGAARSKVNGVVGGPRRGGAVYEIIETPRSYQRPMYKIVRAEELTTKTNCE